MIDCRFWSIGNRDPQLISGLGREIGLGRHYPTFAPCWAVRCGVRGRRVEEVGAEFASGPRGGSAHLRCALDEVGEAARSVAEASALGQLRRWRIPNFAFNVPVLDRAGVLMFEIDVLWRAYRAAMEIDGRRYHSERTDWDATLGRHDLITAAAGRQARPGAPRARPVLVIDCGSTVVERPESAVDHPAGGVRRARGAQPTAESR